MMKNIPLGFTFDQLASGLNIDQDLPEIVDVDTLAFGDGICTFRNGYRTYCWAYPDTGNPYILRVVKDGVTVDNYEYPNDPTSNGRHFSIDRTDLGARVYGKIVGRTFIF